jgi:hypothetical protein
MPLAEAEAYAGGQLENSEMLCRSRALRIEVFCKPKQPGSGRTRV